MRPRRRLPVAIIVLLALILGACGAPARHRALHDTLVSIDAARDGFLAADHARELAIVADAKSREELDTKMAAHRAEADRVVVLLVVVYEALKAAAIADDDPSLAAGAKAGVDFLAAVKGVK